MEVLANNVNFEKTQEQKTKSWESDLSRLVRRAEIFRQLQSNISLEEIKGAVREHENELGTMALIENLVSKEFVVSPKVDKLVDNLSRILVGQFNFIDSIVLLGSSLHGGAAVRKATLGIDAEDLDWGLIFKGEMPKIDLIRSVKEHAENIIPKLTKKYDLPDEFNTCSVINPINYKAPRIENFLQIKNVLIRAQNSYEDEEFLKLYMSPSYPAMSNQTNRRMLLTELSKISKEDKSLWESIIADLSKDWRGIHRIKPKHIGFSDLTDRDKRFVILREKTSSASGYVMVSAMKALLESTENGIVKPKPEIYRPSY